MRRQAAALLAGAVLLTGCTSTPDEPAPEPGRAKIVVDTPELRKEKRAAGVADCAEGDAEPVAGGLPDVTLPCFGGGTDVELGSLRGPLVVNLWASWCGPCREEMPVLQQFHEKYADRVPIIGVDYEDPQVPAAMDLVQETGVTYPLHADTPTELQGAAPFPGQMRLPMFVFVDQDGQATVVAQRVETLYDIESLVEDQLGVTL